MPQHLGAHHSSAHRRACLSLYKALLKQSVILSATQSAGLRSAIRQRFKTDRFLKSASQIANGLSAGNEFLRLLCASAQGETNSINRLSSLLESTLKLSEAKKAFGSALRSVSEAKSFCPSAEAAQVRSSAEKPSQSGTSNSRPVLERPLPLAEIRGGKRRVPKFLAVQGVPFLRYSKPQSPILGRVLRQKIAWGVKKWEQRKKLTNETIPLGEDEDDWDELVARQEQREGITPEKVVGNGGGEAADQSFRSWTSHTRAAEAGIAQNIREYDQKNLELSRRMVEIMKQERELAAKEKAESKSSKYKQHTLRRGG